MKLELLTLEEVAAKLTISRRTLQRMIDRGEFIQPTQVALRRIAFRQDLVEAWVESRGRCLPIDEAAE